MINERGKLVRDTQQVASVYYRSRFRVESSSEDRQAAKERTGLIVEQVIGPGDGVAHGSLP